MTPYKLNHYYTELMDFVEEVRRTDPVLGIFTLLAMADNRESHFAQPVRKGSHSSGIFQLRATEA